MGLSMEKIIAMFEYLNAGIVASDAEFKVIYQNQKCRDMFEEAFGTADYIGRLIHECHNAAATEKIKGYYREYKEKERVLDYYVMDEAGGKMTIVNVPFYDENGTFGGVVEFIFESSLD